MLTTSSLPTRRPDHVDHDHVIATVLRTTLPLTTLRRARTPPPP
ncbi:MAG: hypothetical protein ACRDXE_08110 [Acidimicrobiales bacterium]